MLFYDIPFDLRTILDNSPVVDRVMAVFLHLRYQALVTSKRIAIALVSLWLTRIVAVSSSFILLPNQNNMVVVTFEFFGLLITTVGYVHIYKVVRYPRNQIASQSQIQNNQNIVNHKCFACLHCFRCLFSSQFVLHFSAESRWSSIVFFGC